jgi:hypothetical protein
MKASRRWLGQADAISGRVVHNDSNGTDDGEQRLPTTRTAIC